MIISNEELQRILKTLYKNRNSEENKNTVGLVENTPRNIVKIPFTYNINDSLKTDEDIKKIVKKFNKKIRDVEDDNELFEIGLTLEKGASIYKIDDYFSRILSELKLPEKTKFRVVVNFGDKKLGKNNVRYLLGKAESANLIRLQQVLEKHNGTLFFSEKEEPNVLWTLNNVLKANDGVYDLAKTIKENNLSPFEALLYICTWEQKNIQYDWSRHDRRELYNTIVSAMNNKSVRCVGFSQLVKAVVDVLGVDYLQEDKCLMNVETLMVGSDKEQKGNLSYFSPSHSQSKYYLIDKKYDIEGEIIADPLSSYEDYYYLWKLANNITVISMRPLNTFSKIKDELGDYKIYDFNNKECIKGYIKRNKVIIEGKTQSKILKDTEKKEKISIALEQKNISEAVLKQAYEKIIPLVFPEAQAGDLIVPVIPPTIKEEGYNGVSMWYDLGVVPNEGKEIVMDILQDHIKEEHSL